MFYNIFIRVFETEVIDNQTESDIARYAFPQAGIVGMEGVSLFCEMSVKLFIRQNAGLEQSIHAFHNF
jgi:hypothetical protein